MATRKNKKNDEKASPIWVSSILSSGASVRFHMVGPSNKENDLLNNHY